MRNFWCAFFLCFLRAESHEEKAQEMSGTLGGSLTFHLRTSNEHTLISWLRTGTDIPLVIAIRERGPPCRLLVQLSKFQGRLNVSGDCRNLEISNLEQDDSGTYSTQAAGKREGAFKLTVYKNLSGSDLDVQCENKTFGAQNYTLQLNCSVGKWEDEVNYTWTPPSKKKISSRVVQAQFEDDDMNYTCTAENPVSKASKTVSVKEACEANHPTTEPVTEATKETGSQTEEQSSAKVISVVIPVVAIVLISAVCMGYCLWKKKRGTDFHSAPDEPNKTIYSQIGCPPAETRPRGTKNPQQRKGAKDKDGVSTVYATVNLAKPTPLQTDDEKIQMEGLGASEKSAKKAYSPVTKPQEADDPSIKTVYDMLSAPRCRDESEFHKLL